MIVRLKAKDILLYLLFLYGKFGVLMEKIMIFSSFTIPLNIPLVVVSFIFFNFYFFFSKREPRTEKTDF